MSDPTPPQDELRAEPNGAAVPTAARRGKKRGLVIGGIAVAIAAAAALTVFVALRPTTVERAGDACAGTKPLQKVFEGTSASASPEPSADTDNYDDLAEYFENVVSVEDGGTTLIVNTLAEDEDILGLSSLALNCVYEELDVPTYISENIGQTRALDGRQNAEWDDFSVSWSYHPDDGANVIFVQK